MSRYFSFRFRQEPKQRDSLVIFCHSDIDVPSLTKVIRDDVKENLLPHCVMIIKYHFDLNTYNELISDNIFIGEIESWVGNISEKLFFLSVNSEGSISDIVSNNEFSFSKSLLTSGAAHIFQNRKGLITSLPSYHFVKPSGDHCDKFIRASNLFTSGVEVAFLSIGLLPYLKENIKQIYVDTSSISFLVSIAIQLSNKFKDNAPIIESFESYSVFKKSYDFNEKNSLVIISATTSGGLAKRLTLDTTFTFNDIITLFYSTIPSDQTSIFCISKAINGNIYSSHEADCKLCLQGSKIIKIEGEQFLPETPKHELLVIKKVDYNKERQDFFKEFATKGFLKFDIATTQDLDKEHFYVDIKKIIESNSKSFITSLTKKVNKHFSRDIKTVISIDDSDAKILAQKILDITGDNSIKLVCYKDITEDDLKNHSSVMVIASAITSGRQLLAAARKLRGIDPSATITYLVGFAKLPTEDAFEQLRKDLCLGGHELISLRTCYLPRFREGFLTPWDIERQFLSEIGNPIDPFSDDRAALPQILATRLEKETELADQNSLFLPTPTGEVLKLRNTFAFWSGTNLKPSESSQADVYWTIQAILHDLRLKHDNGLATTYHSTLISPVCFDRYNDGLIQSCLLRAAKSIELNYAVEEEFSRQITDIIISIIENHDNPQGEACLEFLLAICTGRLKIQNKHLNEVVGLKIKNPSDEVSFLLRQIRKSLD
jgi:hypothetical protein